MSFSRLTVLPLLNVEVVKRTLVRAMLNLAKEDKRFSPKILWT